MRSLFATLFRRARRPAVPVRRRVLPTFDTLEGREVPTAVPLAVPADLLSTVSRTLPPALNGLRPLATPSVLTAPGAATGQFTITGTPTQTNTGTVTTTTTNADGTTTDTSTTVTLTATARVVNGQVVLDVTGPAGGIVRVLIDATPIGPSADVTLDNHGRGTIVVPPIPGNTYTMSVGYYTAADDVATYTPSLGDPTVPVPASFTVGSWAVTESGRAVPSGGRGTLPPGVQSPGVVTIGGAATQTTTSGKATLTATAQVVNGRVVFDVTGPAAGSVRLLLDGRDPGPSLGVTLDSNHEATLSLPSVTTGTYTVTIAYFANAQAPAGATPDLSVGPWTVAISDLPPVTNGGSTRLVDGAVLDRLALELVKSQNVLTVIPADLLKPVKPIADPAL